MTFPRTFLDLIDYFLGGFRIEIVDDYVCSPRGKQQGIAKDSRSDRVACNIPVFLTYVLPNPPPAPVMTTVCPLNERVISGIWKDERRGYREDYNESTEESGIWAIGDRCM